ncbi:MAG: 30S ribosomal protein S17 [Candidatus Liptonbacteria bacterium]
MEQENKHRKLIGVVVSDKMQKTCVVAVSRLKKHPKYLKYYKVTAKFKVHDENNDAKTGDKVVIEESRPLSKDKRWTLKEITEKAKVKEVAEKGTGGEEA